MEVNKENMRKWVNGLRSGIFPQGRGFLASRINAGGFATMWEYCCLGVACELAIQDGVRLAVESHTRGHGVTEKEVLEYDGCEYHLPTSVCEWLGLDIDNPILTGTQRDGHTASELNDGDGVEKHTFEQIADFIEARYLADDDPCDAGLTNGDV